MFWSSLSLYHNSGCGRGDVMTSCGWDTRAIISVFLPLHILVTPRVLLRTDHELIQRYKIKHQ